jgi:HD-GYP domain-containing protein (c-di-GMP phosphodiesterase class II)
MSAITSFEAALPAGVIGSFATSSSFRVKQLEAKLKSTHTSIICALNQMLDLKDFNTGFHSTRLAEWAVRVAQELGMDDSCLHDVEVAALLHDIGKVGIPDAILKKPGRLSDDEYGLMKKHPEYGWAVVRLFPDLERASLFILHHHEAYAGNGYPGGLKGNEIPIGARIVSVIDTFDAMVSSRVYRTGLPFEEAMRRLILASATQLDPLVVQCFTRIAQSEYSHVFAATGTATSVVL